MELRIAKMEQEIAIMAHTQKIMSESLRSIAKTLERISEMQLDTKLLEEKFSHLNSDLQESFSRVHKRVDSLEATITWVTRIIVGTLITGIIAFIIKGGIV